MRKLLVSTVGVVALCLTVLRGADASARDFLTVLGLERVDAEWYVFESIAGEYVRHPTGDRVRAVAVGDRPAMVREVIEFVRDYTDSPAFLKRWEEARQNVKPLPPQAPKTAEEMLAAMKADMQQQLTRMESEAKSASGEMKAMLLESVRMIKEQLVELDSPAHPYRDPAMQAILAQGAAQQNAEHEAKLAEWEKEYPADPASRIAGRIEATLAACADVDFGARLVEGDGGRKLFADAAYEARPPEWKACYRAGPETVASAREALGEWLAAIR